MPLRAIIEHYTQYDEGLTHNERIEVGRQFLFNFEYPYFNEEMKVRFETNFIRNFYMKEIGFETEGLFKMRLENWLNINMPYWNKMFESELIKFDPLINAYMDTERDRTNNKDRSDLRNIHQTSTTDGTTQSNLTQGVTSESDTTDTSFNRNLGSDNPDSRLSITPNADGSGVIEYANKIDESKGNNSANATASSDTISSSEDQSVVGSEADQSDQLSSNVDELEKYIEKRTGKIGIDSQSKLLQDFRNTFVRIEKEMFREMQCLFMLVY